jgi:hypothetical protein
VWDVREFRYSKTTATNQNRVHEEIKRRLNSGNACCHSVQSLLFPLLLFVNILVEIEMYKTIIVSVVLYGYETLCVTLREEHRLRVSITGFFGLWPSSGIPRTRKHNVSETMCFRPDTGHCRRDLTGKCAIKIVIKHAQN